MGVRGWQIACRLIFLQQSRGLLDAAEIGSLRHMFKLIRHRRIHAGSERRFVVRSRSCLGRDVDCEPRTKVCGIIQSELWAHLHCTGRLWLPFAHLTPLCWWPIYSLATTVSVRERGVGGGY